MIALRTTILFLALIFPFVTVSASPLENRQAKVGFPAPPFSVKAVTGDQERTVSLDDYRGKWLVLFFYPADFSFVCPTEITGFNREMDRFTRLGAEILGGSVDSIYAHRAWISRGDLGELRFPLFSDQRREMADSYGVLTPDGVALRGLFIIDPSGIIQYQVVHNLAVGRSVDEVLRVLEGLQADALCPLNWKPGQKTIEKRIVP